MARIKIDTLQTKIEFIVLSLGGKPDEDMEENQKNEDMFESIAQLLKD